MISEEELEKFKKKNITDKTIIELENALRVSISITAKYQDKKKFKSYMLAVRCLQDEIIRLKRENDRLTNELNTCMIERNNFLSRIEKQLNI